MHMHHINIAEQLLLQLANLDSLPTYTMTTIKRIVAIMGGACKRDPWYINEIELVDGVEMFKLRADSSGFQRFVLGNCDKKKALQHTDYLDDLRKKRNRARYDSPSEQQIFDERPAFNRYQKRKLRDGDKDSKEHIIVLHLPEVKHELEYSPAISLKVKNEKQAQLGVSVELSMEVVDYLRIAILADLAVPTGRAGAQHVVHTKVKPDVPSSTDCRWVVRRKMKGYLLTRPIELKKADGSRCKFLRCLDATNVEMINKLHDKGKRWVGGEEVSEDEAARDRYGPEASALALEDDNHHEDESFYDLSEQ